MPGQTMAVTAACRRVDGAFNGGPGNCPAKRTSGVNLIPCIACLQWRAGQLPGQTAASKRHTLRPEHLQWRAGQLPGQTTLASSRNVSRRVAFNGGPGNCPAKPAALSG